MDTIQLSGLAGADALAIDLTGVSNPAMALDGNGSGTLTSSTYQSISLISIESVPSFGDAMFRHGFE